MSEINSDLGNIPQIWSNQIWWSPFQNPKSMGKPDVAMFDNAPNDVTLWSFFWKIFIGAVVWLCVAALLFWTLLALGWIIWSNIWEVNPLIKVLLPVVGFIVWFVWNLALAGLYNIFFSKRYYSFWKMCGLIFTSSIILFIFFFILYFLFNDIVSLYQILWFQIVFWLYISLNLIDFLSQPNYSAASLMWNTLWCILSVVVFLGIIHAFAASQTWATIDPTDIIIPIIISSVLSYAIMTLWAWIWDAIYYKFFERWNNPFYLPSLNELREERRKEEIKNKKEEEEVNVEMK